MINYTFISQYLNIYSILIFELTPILESFSTNRYDYEILNFNDISNEKKIYIFMKLYGQFVKFTYCEIGIKNKRRNI